MKGRRPPGTEPRDRVSDDLPPRLDARGFEELAHAIAPMVPLLGLKVERFDHDGVVLRLPRQELALRHGGSVSGPAMMTLGDVTLWGAVLARIGHEPMCVTTDLTFHFLAKPREADLIGSARVLRLGRTLATVEGWFHAEGAEEPVAHAVGTYAIPRRIKTEP